MEFKNIFLIAVSLAVVQLISSLPLPADEATKVAAVTTTTTTTEKPDAKIVTEKTTLGGKMLGGQMGYGGYNGYNNMYGSGMMSGFNPMMGGGMMGGMYPMAPGGGFPSIGGSGYLPNWLQQYDMLYSRNRKSM